MTIDGVYAGIDQLFLSLLHLNCPHLGAFRYQYSVLLLCTKRTAMSPNTKFAKKSQGIEDAPNSTLAGIAHRATTYQR